MPSESDVLVERQRIIDRIVALFVSTDERDWPAVEQCFTAEVLFDMRSAGGGDPGRMPAARIVDGWRTGLAPLKAIHHQAGNFRVQVEGGHATASCYGIAYHYLPNPSGRNTRVFVGSYEFELAREHADWRISHFRFNLKFVDGNPDLEHRS